MSSELSVHGVRGWTVEEIQVDDAGGIPVIWRTIVIDSHDGEVRVTMFAEDMEVDIIPSYQP